MNITRRDRVELAAYAILIPCALVVLVLAPNVLTRIAMGLVLLAIGLSLWMLRARLRRRD